MSKSTQRNVSAISAGKLAARNGLTKKENPFRTGTHMNSLWWDGFQKETEKIKNSK